jgi:hypothetical protein
MTNDKKNPLLLAMIVFLIATFFYTFMLFQTVKYLTAEHNREIKYLFRKLEKTQ